MAIASISEKIKDPRSKKRNLVMFLGLILLVAVLFISVIIGTANTSFSDLYNVFVGVQNTESYRILYHIRIPRVLTAMFAGINLVYITRCIEKSIGRSRYYWGISRGCSCCYGSHDYFT